MSISIHYDSLSKICNGSKHIVVYGYKDCLFELISEQIKEDRATAPFKHVLDWRIGDEFINDDALLTLDGTQIERIKVDYNEDVKRSCKATLVQIVFENFKRKKMGLPLIPVIFCVDIDANKWVFRPTDTLSKAPGLNKLRTHSEIRRCDKLCNTFSHSKIREVAQETFKFVKVKKLSEASGTDHLGFEEIAAPWKSPEWEAASKKRKEQPSDPRKTKFPWGAKKEFPWREELSGLVAYFESQQIEKPEKTGAEKDEKKKEVSESKISAIPSART